jgi:hypothetical protein
VTEIDRPRRTGRTQAKSDPLDAIRAGREALSREHLATPQQPGQREALRVLQLTRSGAVKVAADARRHLKALLVTAPETIPFLVFATVGAVIVSRRPGNVIGWLCCAIGFGLVSLWLRPPAPGSSSAPGREVRPTPWAH